jgi:hypothetical protein
MSLSWPISAAGESAVARMFHTLLLLFGRPARIKIQVYKADDVLLFTLHAIQRSPSAKIIIFARNFRGSKLAQPQ